MTTQNSERDTALLEDLSDEPVFKPEPFGETAETPAEDTASQEGREAASESEEPTEEKAEQPDSEWQAERERLEAELDKTRNDLKALQGRYKQAANIEALIGQVEARLDAQERVLQSFMRHAETGDYEGLTDEVSQIQQQQQQTRVQSRVEQRYQAIMDAVMEMGKRGDDVIVDVKTDPRLESLRSEWGEAVARYERKEIDAQELISDLSLLAMRQGSAISGLVAEEQQKQQAESAKQADTERRRTMENSALLDNGSSGGAGPAETPIKELVRKYADDPSSLTKEQREKVFEHLDGGLSAAPGSIFRQQ